MWRGAVRAGADFAAAAAAVAKGRVVAAAAEAEAEAETLLAAGVVRDGAWAVGVRDLSLDSAARPKLSRAGVAAATATAVCLAPGPALAPLVLLAAAIRTSFHPKLRTCRPQTSARGARVEQRGRQTAAHRRPRWHKSCWMRREDRDLHCPPPGPRRAAASLGVCHASAWCAWKCFLRRAPTPAEDKFERRC